jgi:hypothetical protein
MYVVYCMQRMCDLSSCRFSLFELFAGTAPHRMTIYSDFGSSFDRTKTGAENPVYKPRDDAQPLYGHAVLIVGECSKQQLPHCAANCRSSAGLLQCSVISMIMRTCHSGIINSPECYPGLQLASGWRRGAKPVCCVETPCVRGLCWAVCIARCSAADSSSSKSSTDQTLVICRLSCFIPGYDNAAKAWLVLNRYGTDKTADGLFRIAMGAAGVCCSFPLLTPAAAPAQLIHCSRDACSSKFA